MSDYGVIMGVQCPGSLGDSSRYNIDGCCFVSPETESIICGKFVTVKRIEDGYKEISDKFSVRDLPYGVALRTHMNTAVDDEGYMVYPTSEPINVISHGRAWVLTQDIDQAPTFGTPAKHAIDGFASKDGTEISGWHYTGGWQKWNGLFYIVEVQLIQNAPHIAAGSEKLVRGAEFDFNLPSPQANTKVIIATVDVAPVDATDKTGTWSVSNATEIADQEVIATVTPRDDSSCMLACKEGQSGEVFLNWTANDGSGVSASKPFTFTA